MDGMNEVEHRLDDMCHHVILASNLSERRHAFRLQLVLGESMESAPFIARRSLFVMSPYF